MSKIIKDIKCVFFSVLGKPVSILPMEKLFSMEKNARSLQGGILKSACRIKLKSYGGYIGFNTIFASWPSFPHSYNGVFISDNACIGKNCVIYQQVTIGSTYLENTNKAEEAENTSSKFGAPNIGDNCYIGAGAKIIGKVTIGNNVKIGAGAIVVDDIPDNCTVVSPKARIVKMNNAEVSE